MAIKNVSFDNNKNEANEAFLNQIQDVTSDEVTEVKTPVINEKPEVTQVKPESKQEVKPEVKIIKPAEVKNQPKPAQPASKNDGKASRLETLAWKAYCALNNNKKLPFKKLSDKEIAKVLHSYGLVKFGNTASFSKDLVLAELEKLK